MPSEHPTCGICRRPPRRGVDMTRIRLAPEDLVGERDPDPAEPGLYQCCRECHDHFLPKVAARMGKKVEEMTAHCAV